MAELLLIDDCSEVRLLVSKNLEPHNVTTCENINEAKKLLESQRFDLILLDVDLPDGNGCDFCSELYQSSKYSRIPRIILSAKGEVNEKVFGLYSGADDYVAKPFSYQELKARIEVCLRRKQKQVVDKVRFYNFQFDLDFQKCFLTDGDQKEDLNLTPTEYRIFYTLASHEKKPFSRSELVKEIWNKNGLNIEARGIDSHMSHLRKKLKAYHKYIVSVYGRGYVFHPREL